MSPQALEPVAGGTLYVVATPIGNRGDLSPRAARVLASVDVVAAEDTRHTGRLLRDLGIHADLISVHEHNEQARVPGLIQRLTAGADVALVSDAGTPGISDPGYRLVAAAHAAACRVISVAGPSAAIAALAGSGQPPDRFVFEGFLPARARARRQRLRTLAAESRTLVFYEATRRLEATLADMIAALGETRSATLARELSKQHETLGRGTLKELRAWVAADADQRRGEAVVVVAGAPDPETPAAASLDTVLAALLPELPPSRAAAAAARLTGVRRRDAYQAALHHSANASSPE